MNSMKEVSLHYRNVPIFITDEAYDAIVQIVKENRICEYCTNRYSEANPRVQLNRCLACFLSAHPDLAFVGFLSSNETYDDEEYTFLDHQGYAWVSHSNSNKRV